VEAEEALACLSDSDGGELSQRPPHPEQDDSPTLILPAGIISEDSARA
jgi:hypothetical protein